MNELMDKFRRWYIYYYVEINWFIIGWLSMALLEALSRGNITAALIDAILIFLNYSMYKR